MAPRMTDHELDAYLTAGATALGLSIDLAWRASVAANLRVLFAAAALIEDVPLGPHAEPAPMFRPDGTTP